MNDPYKILGVSPTASDETVREAYKRMAVKYSTDDYADSSLGDIAEQRMAELDAAFDQIMSARRVGAAKGNATGSAGSAQQNRQAGYTSTSYADTSDPESWQYQDIREHLRRGDIRTAEQRLLAIDGAARGAEWHFLMGNVCRAKGWLDEARRYYGTATSMDPNNYEYATTAQQLERERQTGQGTYQPYGGSTTQRSGCADDLGSLCSCLCCMSLCNSCCCGR